MRIGYDLIDVRVDALSSTKPNVRQISDAILTMKIEKEQARVVLIGYSKGA